MIDPNIPRVRQYHVMPPSISFDKFGTSGCPKEGFLARGYGVLMPNVRGSTGSAYWEGLSELRDADGRRVGLGYLEMTGRAGRLRL